MVIFTEQTHIETSDFDKELPFHVFWNVSECVLPYWGAMGWVEEGLKPDHETDPRCLSLILEEQDEAIGCYSWKEPHVRT